MSKPILGVSTGSGKPVELDIDALVEGGLLITASSGNGKSYTFRKIAELSHTDCQQIIIDPEGEFASLRELKDNNYLLAAAGNDEHADIKIHPNMAEMLARKVLEMNLSIIIDISELSHTSKYSQKRDFLAKFINGLVDAPKEFRRGRKCIILIDEAHQHCPQTVKRFENTDAKDAIIALAEKGRKRGLRVILATQRLSKLDKDASSELKNQLVGGLNRLDDRKRAVEEIGYDVKRQDELRTIPQGVFLAMGNAFGSKDAIPVQIDKVKTTHLRPDMINEYKPPVVTSKVKEMLKELGDLPEQAQQELKTRQGLEAEIARLQVELRKKELSGSKQPVRVVQTPPSQQEIIAIKKEGYNEGWGACWHEWNRFVAAIPNDLGKAARKISELVEIRDTLSDVQRSLLERLPSTAPKIDMPTMVKVRPKPKVVDADKEIETVEYKAKSVSIDTGLSPTANSILKFLAQQHGRAFNKSAICVNTGFSAKSSGVSKALSQLVEYQHITKSGPDAYTVEEGPQLANAKALLGDSFEDRSKFTVEDWANSKLSGSEQKILRTMIDNGRLAQWSTDQIAQYSGISRTSSGLSKALRNLIDLGLIQRVGPSAYMVNTLQ